MANAQRPHRRVVRNYEIEDLLNDSEIEEDQSQQDDSLYSDSEFLITSDRNDNSSSESETSESETTETTEAETSSSVQHRTPRGRGRGRGRINSTGTQRQNVSASDGATNTGWSGRSFSPYDLELMQPSYPPNAMQETDDRLSLFMQYVDDDIIKEVVDCTNQTEVKMTGKTLNLTVKELYVYIGISFVMSTINYPWLRRYWEKKWRVAIIADNMSRNRFLTLRNSLKFVYDDNIPNETKTKDKLWKMRPLIGKVQEGCRRQEKQKKMSIDEMMIPFTGSCPTKQYCPMKPHPVGLKAFTLANPNGLICDFDVYQGNTTYPQFESSNYGLGEKSVLSLADSLVPGHTLYIDRYFTSTKLAKELLNRGIRCTGTIQKNRVPRDARHKFMADNELKRRGRGSLHTIVSDDGKLAITKWFDNKPVLMLSTAEAQEPLDVCRRWCKRTKCYVNVERPRVVRNYNTYMGGVDLADRQLSVCPYRYRTRKWTQRFASHMFDLAVCNCWVQYKTEQIRRGVPVKKVQQLRNFKMDLGEQLIELNSCEEEISGMESDEQEQTVPRKRGRPTPIDIPSKKRRLQNAKHMPLFEDKQSRCRHCHNSKSRTKCSSCKIYLCLNRQRNCYKEFHE